MFLRKTQRKKDGKTHEYWSVVENKRVAGGGVVRCHVLYLGEFNSSQAAWWRKAIEVLDDDAGLSRTLALFPEDRCAAVASDASIVQLRLSDMRLCRPRQWGACWLAGQFAGGICPVGPVLEPRRLPPNRKGTALGSGLAGAGLVSIDRTGQQVEVAPAIGSARALWPTCWGRTSDWRRRTSCTPVMTFCRSTKTRYSHI